MFKRFKQWKSRSSKIRRINTYTAIITLLLIIMFGLMFVFPMLVDAFLIVLMLSVVVVCVWMVIYMIVMG